MIWRTLLCVLVSGFLACGPSVDRGGSGGAASTTGAPSATTSASTATTSSSGGGAGGAASSSAATTSSTTSSVATASAGASSSSGAGGAPPTGPTVVRSFDGDIGQPGASCGGSPGCLYKDHPDMGVAASGSQVVEVTGQYVTVFDYSGATLAKTALPAFISGAGLTPGAINDPRIAYDPFISRWIVACSCASDFLIVSASSDATGAWKGVALGLGSGDLTMFPGWDRNGVYVSEYGGSTTSVAVAALPAADVAWTGTGNVSLLHLNVFPGFPFETRPAQDPTPNKAPTAPAYFLARGGPPQNANNLAIDVLVDSLTWSGTVATQGPPHVLPSGYLYNTPVTVGQPTGPGLRAAESHRFFSAFLSGGHLHGVLGSGPCVVSCGAQGADTQQLFFWFDVDTASMSIAQSAKVSSPTLGYLFPALAVDATGNVGIAATVAGTTRNPSVVLFSHRTTDPVGQLSGPVTATVGIQTYACDGVSPVGWGTYAMGTQDPGDPTKLWAVAEYGGAAIGCQWHTRLIQYQP